jgi:hypothetical protein
VVEEEVLEMQIVDFAVSSFAVRYWFVASTAVGTADYSLAAAADGGCVAVVVALTSVEEGGTVDAENYFVSASV